MRLARAESQVVFVKIKVDYSASMYGATAGRATRGPERHPRGIDGAGGVAVASARTFKTLHTY
jgi:hypothetical protein